MKFFITFWIVFAFSFTIFIFRNISGDQFLFQQDEYLPLSKTEIENSFSLLDPVDLGMRNATIVLVTFFDRLYYYILDMANFDLGSMQRMLYFIKFILLSIIPLFGFKMLSYRFNAALKNWQIFCISCFYSFNTFTLIYWHGNGFSLTLLLCYAFLPISFYLIHRAIITKLEIRYLIFLSISLALMSYALYFFAVVLLFLGIYLTFISVKYPVYHKHMFRNFFLVFLLMLPLLGHHYLSVREMFLSPIETQNSTGGETYGNIQGGVLYQMLMWHTWAIYVEWFPRNLYTFSDHFKSFGGLFAPICIYLLIIYKLRSQTSNFKVLLLFFILLLLLVISQGSQEPFGFIYRWLIDNISPFRIFRSPDNKFGFVLMFLISLLLLMLYKFNNKKIFVLILSVSFFQSLPLLSGEALLGVNSKNTSDKILNVNQNQQEIINYISENTQPFGYILPFPPEPFGHYTNLNKKLYIGQDLLLKMSHLPFLTPNDFSGISVQKFNLINDAIANTDFSQLNTLPIRFFLFRRDTVPVSIGSKEEIWLSNQNTTKVVENSDYVLYKNNNPTPIFNLARTEYTRISQTKYLISNIDDVSKFNDLLFSLNADPEWQLIKNDNYKSKNCALYFDFENGIKECFNSGSNDNALAKYSVVYGPQKLFDLLTKVSIFFLLGCCFVVLANTFLRYRYFSIRNANI